MKKLPRWRRRTVPSRTAPAPASGRARRSPPTPQRQPGQRGPGGQGADHRWTSPRCWPAPAPRSGRASRPRPGPARSHRGGPGAVALARPPGSQRDHRQSHRDVEPEDPVPAEALQHGAADDRVAGHRRSAIPLCRSPWRVWLSEGCLRSVHDARIQHPIAGHNWRIITVQPCGWDGPAGERSRDA